MEGPRNTHRGAEFLRALVRLSTEHVLQEALEPEQAAARGRRRPRGIARAMRTAP